MSVLNESKTMSESGKARQGRLRIAWISDVGPGGGVPGMATLLVAALSAQDCELVVFSRTPRQDIDRLFSGQVLERTSFFVSSYQWEWGKWYSRDRRCGFIASFFKQKRGRGEWVSGLVI